jgi:hypothetical protein
VAQDYKKTIQAHPSVYQPPCERKLDVYYCVPDQGINDDTGLLMLIPGFDANADSKVYQKMRRVFSDQYNLVTVQCNYFGYEFMQTSDSIFLQTTCAELKNLVSDFDYKQIVQNEQINFLKLTEFGSKYNIRVLANEALSETLSNFNDMSIMQAIDCLTALLSVIQIIKNQKKEFNTKKIIAYGYSHGAYLAYLCNAFCPTLFSSIIDNSGWLFPIYLKNDHDRFLEYSIEKLIILIKFDYLAKKLNNDFELLELTSLYSKFINRCNIIIFQGTTDNYITHEDKLKFCKVLNSYEFNLITLDKVDGIIFKSTNHGLSADFLKLFDYVIKKNTLQLHNDKTLEVPKNISIQTKHYCYAINYSNYLPNMTIQKNQI